MLKTDCDHATVKVTAKGPFRELRGEMLVTCIALLKVYKKALRENGYENGEVNLKLDEMVNIIWDEAVSNEDDYTESLEE